MADDRVHEVEAFPLLLSEIKAHLGDKELSISAPCLERDMVAFTPENIQLINNTVDFVNV